MPRAATARRRKSGDVPASRDEDTLRLGRAFRRAAEAGGDIVMRYDRDCRRTYVNPAFSRKTGVSGDVLLGCRPTEVSLLEDAVVYEAALRRVLAEGREVELECCWLSSESDPLLSRVCMLPEFDDAGKVSGVLTIGRDVTLLRRYESSLRDLTERDALTDLPNRRYLDGHLARVLGEAGTQGQRVALLMLDIDRFKLINDIHGHQTGDRLLVEVARRLQAAVGDAGLLGRLVGDEFAIVQQRFGSIRQLRNLADQVIETLASPFLIDGIELFTSGCIGIAVYPDDACDAPTLLQYANTALHESKRAGRGQFSFYSADLTERTRERFGLEGALRNAVRNGELVLFFQPKVDVTTTRMHGVEALLRWQHPKLGRIGPDRFIGLAEETGMIVEIGLWVLREACRAAVRLNLGAEVPVKVAVNLSPGQFHRGDLFEAVWQILTETGCRADWLEFEVTESLLLEDNERILSVFFALRELGITLAIDDFGTGFSALAYLKRFPIDVLKIDRSFIRDVTLDADSAELVKAIIAMARSLRLEVVAEGVEQEAEEAFLREHGCVLAQGFRYGKPMPMLLRRG